MKIYTKQNCARCEQVKEYMNGKGISYQIIDITNDMDTLTKFREMFPGAGFPVVEFPDGSILAGQVEPIIEKISQLDEPKVEEVKSNTPDYFWGK